MVSANFSLPRDLLNASTIPKYANQESSSLESCLLLSGLWNTCWWRSASLKTHAHFLFLLEKFKLFDSMPIFMANTATPTSASLSRHEVCQDQRSLDQGVSVLLRHHLDRLPLKKRRYHTKKVIQKPTIIASSTKKMPKSLS